MKHASIAPSGSDSQTPVPEKSDTFCHTFFIFPVFFGKVENMGRDPCFREKIAKIRTFSEEFSKTREYPRIVQRFCGNISLYIYVDISVYYRGFSGL